MTSAPSRPAGGRVDFRIGRDHGRGPDPARRRLPGESVPGSAISFDPAVFATQETITLAGSQLELSDTVLTTSITGPAAGVIVSGGGLSSVFKVDPGVTASISGMRITGGNTAGNGGGLYNDGGNVTLTNCTVSDNSAGYRGGGGGIDTVAQGTTTLTDCTVSGNTAFAGGASRAMARPR